jgi:hypothetical protein
MPNSNVICAWSLLYHLLLQLLAAEGVSLSRNRSGYVANDVREYVGLGKLCEVVG